MASTGVAKQYSAYRDLNYTLNIVKKVNAKADTNAVVTFYNGGKVKSSNEGLMAA